MSKVIRQTFAINLHIMEFCGMYSSNTVNCLFKIRAYMMYILFLTPVPIFGCLYLLLEANTDFERFAENACLLSEMSCYITKFLPFFTKPESIKNCILYFESSVFKNSNNEQEKIQEKCNKICQRNTNIFLISVTGGVFSWALKPLFQPNYRLPIDVWLPVDVTKSLWFFYFLYSYLITQVLYAAYSSGAVDPLVAGLACQATGQLKILKYNLQHLSKTENIYESIKSCVTHYNEILKFVTLYQDSFSMVIFSQFVGSVFVICVSCLQITMTEVLSFNFLAIIMFFLTMLSEIYLFCYYGTTLYEESISVTQAIYMGNWYEYDLKSQTALLIFMEGLKKPIIITCGKIMNVSLVTFTTILRRSYSLLAVLQNYKL